MDPSLQSQFTPSPSDPDREFTAGEPEGVQNQKLESPNGQSLVTGFTDLIAAASRILIFPRQRTRGDEITAAFGFGLALEQLGKHVAVISEIPQRLSFVPRPTHVFPKLEHAAANEFIIRVDVTKKGVEELRYEKVGDVLEIYLRAKQGRFEPADVQLADAAPAADLIVTIGAPDLDALGDTFTADPDLFFSRPIVNIDRNPLNEQFGELNVVEPNDASSAEVVMQLITAAHITPDVATCLLAGIAIATRNFQSPTLAAATLTRAARLADHGADRALIVEHLFGAKPVTRLQLAGRILARTTAGENDLYISALQQYDFTKTGATEADLPQAVEELRETFGQLRRLVVLWSTQNGVGALVGTPNRTSHDALAEEGATRVDEETSQLTLDGVGLKEAEERIVAALKKTQLQNG